MRNGEDSRLDSCIFLMDLKVRWEGNEKHITFAQRHEPRLFICSNLYRSCMESAQKIGRFCKWNDF